MGAAPLFPFLFNLLTVTEGGLAPPPKVDTKIFTWSKPRGMEPELQTKLSLGAPPQPPAIETWYSALVATDADWWAFPLASEMTATKKRQMQKREKVWAIFGSRKKFGFRKLRDSVYDQTIYCFLVFACFY